LDSLIFKHNEEISAGRNRSQLECSGEGVQQGILRESGRTLKIQRRSNKVAEKVNSLEVEVNLKKNPTRDWTERQFKCSEEKVRDCRSLEGAKVFLERRFQKEDRAYQKTE